MEFMEFIKKFFAVIGLILLLPIVLVLGLLLVIVTYIHAPFAALWCLCIAELEF